MNDDIKIVWVIDSESAEEKVRSETRHISGLQIVGFRNAAHAVDALRKGTDRPSIILGNYQAADAMIEVAHRPKDYAEIRTAYLSELDLSNLAKCHKAEYVRYGSIADFVLRN